MFSVSDFVAVSPWLCLSLCIPGWLFLAVFLPFSLVLPLSLLLYFQLSLHLFLHPNFLSLFPTLPLFLSFFLSVFVPVSLSLFHSHTLRYLTLYPSFNRFNDESLHTFLLSVCLLVSLSVSLFLLTFVCGESQGTIESGRRRMAGSALHLLPRFMQRQRGQKSLDVSTPRFRAFLFFVFLFLLFLFSTFPPFILSVHLRLWNRVSLRPIEKETLLRSRVLSFSSIHPT